jgi:hypothetical protein
MILFLEMMCKAIIQPQIKKDVKMFLFSLHKRTWLEWNEFGGRNEFLFHRKVSIY